MQIKFTISLLVLIPLLTAASPAPAPVASVPFVRKRTFKDDNGVADIPALQAHIAKVQL